jgi:predicted metal-dependent peptidase
VEALIETTGKTIISENLQWAVSIRGGNNFLGRVLNGCKFIPQKNLGTAGVMIGKTGHNVFIYDPEWLASLPRAKQILVFFHEGAHLALNHIGRFLRLRKLVNNDYRYARRHMVLNVAADMAVNDTALRVFVEQKSQIFKDEMKSMILPEERNYPKNESFEHYAHLLFNDLAEHGWAPDDIEDTIEEIKKQLQAGGGQSKEDQKEQQQAGGGQSKEDQKEQQQAGGGQSKEDQKEQQQAGGEGGEPEKGPPKDNGTPKAGYGPYSPIQDPKLPDWFKGLLARQHAPLDISEIWDKLTESEMERALDNAQREGKKLTQQALDQTRKQRGLIPSALENFLEEFLTPPTVPWEHLFRGMLRSSISSKLTESTVMPNIALFPSLEDGLEPYPGLQKEIGIHIYICVDSSGSVSNDEYTKFMSEIQGILQADTTAKAYLIIFDAAIQYEQEFGEDDDIQTPGQHGLNRYCAGGTDFCPPLRRICGVDTEEDWEKEVEGLDKKLPKPDLVVMFTDGEAPIESPHGPVPDLLPACPLIWTLTPDGTDHPAMGSRVIKIQES